MPMVLAPPALIKWDSVVMTSHTSGTQKWTRWMSLTRHQVGLEFLDALDIEQALLEDLVLGVEQAFLPFRVGGADGPVEGREKNQTGFMLGTDHGSSRRCAPADGL